MAPALNLDSLWGVWNDKTQPDTNRLEAMDKIAWDGYLFSQPDSAFYFAQMQYELAEATGNKQSMADALNTQGATFYIQGNYDKALEYYDKSLKIKEEIGNKNGMADSYGNMGLIYSHQGNHEQALEYNQKSLNIFEEIGNKRGMAASYNNIGIIYKNQGNYEQAMEYYEKSFKIKEELGNKRGMAISYNNIGEIYGEQGNYEKALKYYDKSLKIEEEVGNKTGMAGSYNNMGSLAFEQGNYPEALDLGKKALALAQAVGVVTEIKEASNLLYDIYKKTDQSAKALEMYELYTDMRDSLNSMNNKEAAIKLEYQYKYETQSAIDSVAHAKAQAFREEQIKRQRAELESEKTLRVILFAGIGLISIFLIFAINRFLVTRRQKETIEGQKQVVEEQNKLVEKQKEEKEIMMKEIHHRVKNNMQIVKSLLGLQAGKIDDEKIVAMFEECQSRITAMATIHENMYKSDEFIRIDTREYIQTLVEQIAFSYKLGGKIELKLNIPPIKFSSKTLIPLGLIINEIMTNAFKYAFTDRESGEVTLEVQEINNKEYQMIIGDNGIGMPMDFVHEESNSLGTELVHIFTEQLEGTIERIKQAGTMFKITFIPQED